MLEQSYDLIPVKLASFQSINHGEATTQYHTIFQYWEESKFVSVYVDLARFHHCFMILFEVYSIHLNILRTTLMSIDLFFVLLKV